jgi:hypothetical protein
MSDVTVEIDGHTIEVLTGPYVVDGQPTAAAIEFASQLVALLNRIREFVATEYLALYNDTWREEDAPILALDEFTSRLTNPSIVVYDEIGAATIYFNDSDMFAGHLIEISVESGEIAHASLVG